MKETKKPYKPLRVEPEIGSKAITDGSNGHQERSDPCARVKIRVAMNLLQIKDVRTLEKWCRRWLVPIYKGIGGRFLLADEFKYAQMTEIAQQHTDKVPLQMQMNLKDDRRKTFTANGNLSEEARKFKEYLNKKIG